MKPFFDQEPDSPYPKASDILTMLRENQIPHILVSGPSLLFDPAVLDSEVLNFTLALPDAAILPGLKIENQDEWLAKGFCFRLGLDLLFTPEPLFSQVLRTQTFVGTFRSNTITVATSEGSLVLKLFALPSFNRGGLLAHAILYESDIAQLLAADPIPDATLLDALRPHLMESDVNALAGVLGDIRKQLARTF